MTTAPLPESRDDDDTWLDEALRRYATTRDAAVRDLIAERTAWLATRAARRFWDRGEPFDDLVQVARIGLLKAIDRFDPDHGAPFGSYATPTILGELRRHFRDNTWSLHVPRRAKDLRGAVNDAREALTNDLQRSPSAAEVAAKLGIGEIAVIEALEANVAYRAAPLDSTDRDPTLAVDVDFDAVLDREVVAHLLERLPERSQAILRLRFFDELSQAQIAQRIGTSQVHVGRLIAASLALLRQYAAESGDTP